MTEPLQKYWESCLEMLRAELSETVFNTWFRPIVPVSFEDKKLVLQLLSDDVRRYIEENYIQQFARVLFRVFGMGIQLEYRVLIDSHSGADTQVGSDRFQQENTKMEVFASNPQGSFAPADQQLPELDSRLNSNYTFETFVQGDCNKLVRSVGLTAAKNPGKTTFNPLFIYGGSGVGKTHLLNAIGNQVKQLYPRMRVLYLSANEFKTQYMNAGQTGHVADFVRFYQTVDVLLIDDIQFLAGSKMESTQNQFFHIFNYLHQSQKQIVMTSDRSPMEIKDLEDRLLTRFKWGFQGEMFAPDYALRKDILKNKMLRDGINLPDEVISFIAENVRNNVRDLEGVLASLLAYSMVMDSNIDLRLAEQVVGNVVELGPSEMHLDDITAAVAAEFGVPTTILFSKERQQNVSTARMVAMYLAKKYTSRSLQEIGDYFGGRTHATVLHAERSIRQQLDVNPLLVRRVQKIEQKLAH